MATFEFLMVCGYADGSETYVPLDIEQQPLTWALTEHSFAVWLLMCISTTVDRIRWCDIGEIVPPAMKALMYEYIANQDQYERRFFWWAAAIRARQRAAVLKAICLEH